MAKFILFASPRTGSTSLARVLGTSPGVRLAIEPLHPGFPAWNAGEKNYSALFTDAATLDNAVDDLFSRYDALKVLDYQLPQALYFRLLSRPALKILFLTRRNLAALAVSTQVALQTGAWHKTDQPALYENLPPLDLSRLAQAIADTRRTNAAYAAFLAAQRPGDYSPLYYEDLYSEDFEHNRRTLAAICTFVGIALPPDEAIRQHMLPSNAKINAAGVYRHLPNYAEIVAAFGNIDL